MADFSLKELLASRERSDVDAWGRTINPQFARVLKKIGFDREWVRAEGAYLWDKRGDRYLDMLGGFGMFNVGRNNPRVRAALVEALELDLPGSVQLGASPLPPLLAQALVDRAPPRLRHGSDRGCAQARPRGDRAPARRLGGARLPRAHARRALGKRQPGVHGALRPAAARLLAGAVRRSRRARGRAAPRGRCALPRRAGAGQGRQPASARLPRRRAGTLPPLRHALLCRRGADGLRPHGQAVRVRALGTRAGSRAGREVALGRLRPGRSAPHVQGRPREGVRLARAFRVARLDVRTQRAGDGRGVGDSARARRAGSRRARRSSRRAVARADDARIACSTGCSQDCSRR